MIEQVQNAIIFRGVFTSGGAGKTGLTVTVDVYDYSHTKIVTAASATEVGGGIYRYTLSSGSVTAEGEYIAIFKTTDTTVDAQHRFAVWYVAHAGIEDLDAAISSRSTYAGGDTSGVTTLLSRLSSTRAGYLDNLTNLDATISGIATAVWAAVTRTLTAASDSSGVTTLLSRLSAARAGYLDYLDAAISSRSTYAGTDTAGTTTLLSRLSALRAGYLDYLDAAISGRASQASLDTVAGYVDTEVAAIKAKTDNLPAAPAATGDIPSAATIASTVWDKLTSAITTSGSVGKLIKDYLDAAVSSRASQTSLDTVATYVDTEVAAIKAKTDNLPAAPAATGDIPSAATIASAVWDKLTSAVTTAGSIGKQLKDNLDVVLSTRASQASLDTVATYVDTEVAAIKAKTDNLPSDPADASDIATAFAAVPAAVWASGTRSLTTFGTLVADVATAIWAAATRTLSTSPPTAGVIADAVWDEALSGHLTAGTAGKALNTAGGSSSDPLTAEVPGSYAAGTAGSVLGRFAGVGVTITSPVASDLSVSVVFNSDYYAADGQSLDFLDDGGTWPTLTGASVLFEAPKLSKAGSVVTATGSGKKVRVELSATDTAVLPPGLYAYSLIVTLTGGHKLVLASGSYTVVARNA